MDTIKELVAEISALATIINIVSANDIMIHNYGHVMQLEISIYKDGWGKDKDPIYTHKVYYDSDYCIRELLEIKETLEEIIKEFKESI